jgi:hypothetical protein
MKLVIIKKAITSMIVIYNVTAITIVITILITQCILKYIYIYKMITNDSPCLC